MIKQSGISDGKEVVVPGLIEKYLRADQAEQESLESQRRMNNPEALAGMKTIVKAKADVTTNPITPNTNTKADSMDHLIESKTKRETVSIAARASDNGVYGKLESGSILQYPKWRERELERGKHRILCVDGANAR